MKRYDRHEVTCEYETDLWCRSEEVRVLEALLEEAVVALAGLKAIHTMDYPDVELEKVDDIIARAKERLGYDANCNT